MSKLRVFESISIDGYFTDANGGMDWAHAGREDAEFADWVGANASSGAELLFGRRTYQMMEAFWPTPMAARQMPVVAEGMNACRKHVASRTLAPTWNNTHLLKGELVAAVAPHQTSPFGPSWLIALIDQFQPSVGLNDSVMRRGQYVELRYANGVPCRRISDVMESSANFERHSGITIVALYSCIDSRRQVARASLFAASCEMPGL